jgi:GntR family transcriptional repressor for pyruvate dehydrogenase complex
VFTNVQRVRSFDGVISQIRHAILRGEVAPGDRLPNERELSAQMGVSRATLREGLRALESQGLLDIRLGSTGGIFVAVPDGEVVGLALDSMMHLRNASRWEMQEYRREFEPRNAALAARRATEEDLERLEQAAAAFKQALDVPVDEVQPVRLKCDIHEAIAESTHNEVRASIMVALSHGIMRAAKDFPGAIDHSALALSGKEFDRLIAAIREADSVAAATIMRDHLIWV